jgi:hypothetical protein
VILDLPLARNSIERRGEEVEEEEVKRKGERRRGTSPSNPSFLLPSLVSCLRFEHNW